MASSVEKDEVTGVDTTGHEWDGIKELDNPLPRWWLLVFYTCVAWAVVWWILYPSWPGISGYTKGLLGSNQRAEVEQRIARAREAQAAWREKIAAADATAIARDPNLLRFAVAGGGMAFKENCAPCHALGGAGQLQYPTLADDDWLWGGSLEAIEATVRHGVRTGGAQARDSQMPAFGQDGMLTRAQVRDVAQHVLSLSGKATDPAAAERGKALYAESCASCHGDDGAGCQGLGAPNLADAIWLYGSRPEQVEAQIWRPRQGVMPAWEGRLDDTTIKMLTVYVHSLGGGQ